MEKLKNSINSNQQFTFYLILAILFTCIATVLIFNPKTSAIAIKTDANLSEFELLNDISTEINNINSSLNIYDSGSYIDVSNSIEVLETNIYDLNIVKNHLSSFIVTENSTREILPILTESINKTIDLYNTSLLALKHDSSYSEDEYASQIKELKNSCKSEYEKLASYNINLNFSYDNIEFFDTIYNHLNSLSDKAKENNVKESQINDFIVHLKTNLNSFSPLLQDLYPAISKIRTDNRNLNVILEDIEDKELKFLEIKNITLSTSIPENYSSYYEDIDYIFTLYSNYINSLKIAVISEMSSSYENNKHIIDKNYENAFSKLEDVNLFFDSTLKSLNNF